MSQALSQATQLKADIRLAQALSEFCAGLGETQMREFKSLQTRSPPTPEDVIRLTEEINRDGSRSHKCWRPYATRMALFLDKIQTLARVGDFLVGSSQNLIASGVWTVVKLTLGIAVGSLRFFERISELFLKVGKSSTVARELVQVFPESKELQDLMCEYLIVLVAFCTNINRTLQRSTIAQLTSPFIAFFDKEATKFETELAHWETAIDRRVTVILSRRQTESSNAIFQIGQTLPHWVPSQAKRQNDLALRSSRLLHKLCPRQLERIAAWRRQRKKGTAEWFFRQATYHAWKKAAGSSALYIHGKLGSGKTVLLANMVADLYGLAGDQDISNIGNSPIVAYVFCNRDRPDSNTFDDILGSIVQQILAFLGPESKAVAKMEDYFRRHPSASLEGDAISILRGNIPRDRPIFIVIDALDECKEEHATAILGMVRRLKETCSIHLCLSTRTNAPTTRAISSHLSGTYSIQSTYEIGKHDPSEDAEMKAFIDAELERRRHIRDLDKRLEEIIKAVLFEASEGMYLWVALQIEALFPLHGNTLLTTADVLELLDSPPKELPQVFDKALERISDTRYGNRIFQIIAAARRPLTVAELRIALHVQPGILDWNPMALPHDGRVVIAVCGGGLLEIDEEDDAVRFIHHSVHQHLALPGGVPKFKPNGATEYRFRAREADIHLGTLCVTYLHYSIFETSLVSASNVTVDPNYLMEQVALTSPESRLVSSVIAAIRLKRSSPRHETNIGPMIQRYLSPKVETSELLAFSDYAHDHWVWHTTLFWSESCSSVYPLFRSLLYDPPKHVKVSFPDSYPNDWWDWAFLHGHLGIVLESIRPYYLEIQRQNQLANTLWRVVRNIEHLSEPGPLDRQPKEMLQEVARATLDDESLVREHDIFIELAKLSGLGEAETKSRYDALQLRRSRQQRSYNKKAGSRQRSYVMRADTWVNHYITK